MQATISIIALLIAAMVSSPTEDIFNNKDLSGWKVVLDPKQADAKDVFTVENGIINVKGQPFGYIYTEKSYSDFQLYVEWRYPEKPSNSGIFLFVQEPIFWPNSIEVQLHSGSAGDFVNMGGAKVEPLPLKAGEPRDKTQKYQASSENPIGEWNNAMITCSHGHIMVYVNGVLQNKGRTTGAKSGKIALQSEGAPIQFRNVRLTELTPPPAK